MNSICYLERGFVSRVLLSASENSMLLGCGASETVVGFLWEWFYVYMQGWVGSWWGMDGAVGG